MRGDALAVLEDYAALANAGVHAQRGYGCGPDRGLDLVAQLTSTFLDQGRDTAADDVLASAVDMSDNATPSGWNLAAEALLTASASLPTPG